MVQKDFPDVNAETVPELRPEDGRELPHRPDPATESKQRSSILVAEFAGTVPDAKELLELLGLPTTNVTAADPPPA